MDTKAAAESSTILRAVVGSTLHGLSVGSDDTDEMGVCIEPIELVAGLQSFDQYIYRSAAVREGKSDARSQPGDLDLTIYSLRKYVRLALNGNPTILNLLFVPPDKCLIRTDAGAMLQDLAPAIVSRRAGFAYLGYMQAQRQRLLHERGGKDVNRRELEVQYGFDTKYAMHMVRLGFEGIELMETGEVTFPMPEPARSICRTIRTGGMTLQAVTTLGGQLEAQLKDLIDTSPMREKPDVKTVDEWLVDTYGQVWVNHEMALREP